MRTTFTTVAALVTAAVIAIVLGLSMMNSSAEAQVAGAECSGDRMFCVEEASGDGAVPGTVIVSWWEIPNAAHYRVGWVNMEHYRSWSSGEHHWMNLFNFRDVEYAGSHVEIIDLTPGVEYAFIVSAIDGRGSNARRWSEWVYLTLEEEPSVPCPSYGPGTGGPNNPAAPGVTPTPVPVTGTPAPTAKEFISRIETSSDQAGAAVSVRVEGWVYDPLPAGSAVALYLDEMFQVPDEIPAAAAYFRVSNPVTAAAGNGERQSAIAIEIQSDFYWNEGGDWELLAYMPANWSLDWSQPFELVFEESAGIRNPASGGDYMAGYSVKPARGRIYGPDVSCDHEPDVCLTVTGPSPTRTVQPTPTPQPVVIEPTATPAAGGNVCDEAFTDEQYETLVLAGICVGRTPTPTPQAESVDPTPQLTATPIAGLIDYDVDDDGLIEISTWRSWMRFGMT